MSPEIDAWLAQHALNSANDGLTIADARLPDMPLIYVNNAFEKLTGYRSHDIIGKNCRFLQSHKELPMLRGQHALSELRRALEQAKPCRIRLQNYRKDGTLFWNELSMAPIFDENSELTHYIGIQKDVTKEMSIQQTATDAA